MREQISTTVKSAYNEMYSDRMTAWRELCGKYKAQNILTVSEGHSFGKVLECGAGEGSILSSLDASGIGSNLYAVEISESGVSQIKKRNLRTLKEVKLFDGYTIPYPDQCFDMAYCSHVIEHVEHPRLLLRELKRVSEFQVFEVPLDYTATVDRKTEHFLGYGHINIYTPSLFKFLLKSEGYEIIAERFTRTSEEVTRFNWYHNQKLKKTFLREARLAAAPLFNILRRIKYGRQKYSEYAFSAYTCLARGTGELKIFDEEQK